MNRRGIKLAWQIELENIDRQRAALQPKTNTQRLADLRRLQMELLRKETP